MLVLSRKKNEKIIILTKEGVIEIVIVEIHDGKARLGFQAPKEIIINREEVHKKIVREEKKAMTERKTSFIMTYFDDKSTRKKATCMNPIEIVFDDERNPDCDDYYRLLNMPPGAKIRITIERLDDLPILDRL